MVARKRFRLRSSLSVFLEENRSPSRKVHELEYPWPDGACLLMHSDGITTRARVDAYPGLATRHPALVAGVIFRDFYRGRDDATVLAVRERRA